MKIEHAMISILLVVVVAVLVVVSLALAVSHKKSEPAQRVEDTWSIYIFILAVITIIAVATDQYYQEKRTEKDANQAINVILNELKDNKKALVSNVHDRINYTTGSSEKNMEINYVNAFLELDAYESVLHSGLIKHLPIDIQSRLTMLYSRIRSRNELIDYIDQFEDMFFLHDDSEQTLSRWYKKIEKYDTILTRWEADIIDLLEETVSRIIKTHSMQRKKDLLTIKRYLTRH